MNDQSTHTSLLSRSLAPNGVVQLERYSNKQHGEALVGFDALRPIQNPRTRQGVRFAEARRIKDSADTMQQGEGVETEVTWEDQQNINLFGRLNNKFHELEDDIKAKKDMTDNLEDASNELILADDPEVRYLIGEVFTHLPVDEVETRLESLKEVNVQELESLQEEKSAVLAKMADLKKILYGKFGDSINLEED